jgi:hypothetical protein
MMRIRTGASLAALGAIGILLCGAQAADLTWQIPPVKTSLNVDGLPMEIQAWGTISAAQAGPIRLAMTVDLGSFQENITAVLRAQLNRSDRCGERLSVERATLAPAAPSSVLSLQVHYERFGCVKALGKEVVKRLVGGNAVIEVDFSPSVEDRTTSENSAENPVRENPVRENPVRENPNERQRISLTARVRKMDADGSLGELLNSGQLGDSIREKIGTSVESAVRKSANLKSSLPPEVADVVSIKSVQFANGGGGRLWLAIAGEAALSTAQFQDLSKSGLAKQLVY